VSAASSRNSDWATFPLPMGYGSAGCTFLARILASSSLKQIQIIAEKNATPSAWSIMCFSQFQPDKNVAVPRAQMCSPPYMQVVIARDGLVFATVESTR